MSSVTPDSKTQKNEDVVLRDLQSLLRQTMGEQVMVVNYKTVNLLPKGENYASTMLKVDATIKRSKESSEENLPLVAKMVPTSEFQKEHFNMTVSYLKEIFMLNEMSKVYRDLESDVGICEEELVDLWPKCYGHRLTRSTRKLEIADEDAVLLMENLKERGYYTVDRIKGLDLDHAKLAMTQLARFHALGMVSRVKRPNFFEEVRKICSECLFDIKENEFDDVFEHTFKSICEDSRIREHKDRIRAAMEMDKDFSSFKQTHIEGPWISISHGDFWANNIMFHQNKTGEADDVKFVDFQITRISSPMKDLPYFMLASLSPVVIDDHFDKLLDLYYDKLIEYLERLEFDTSPLSKESFIEQLKIDASNELFHCLMAVKFFTLEVKENNLNLDDMVSSVMLAKGSDVYEERCWKIISKFVQMKWI